jgi:nucleotide-binding universal stress UspA family protein
MTLFRHVLAPIDFSERSHHTALHAAGIARSTNATLTLLHVLPRRRRADPDERRSVAFAALHEVAHQIRTRWPARLAVVDGDPRNEIRNYALDHGADLLVVGSRHRSLLQRLFFASVASRVATAGDWSILAVPDPEDEARRPPANHREMLCAVDLSSTSAAAVEAAVTLARARGAHLTVLHVIAAEPGLAAPTGNDDGGWRREQARSVRQRLALLLAPHSGPTVDLDPIICFGEADEEILRMAGWLRAEILVVGAHSNRLVGDSSLGPTAASVVHQAPSAVLLVRAQAQPAGAAAEALERELVGLG